MELHSFVRKYGNRDLRDLLTVFTLCNIELVSVPEHLLEGSPEEWRADGFVRVWSPH
jgi:hypothetical protein